MVLMTQSVLPRQTWTSSKFQHMEIDGSPVTTHVDDVSTLLGFHEWDHSFGQTHCAKVVHFKELLHQIHRCTFKNREESDAGIVDCEKVIICFVN